MRSQKSDGTSKFSKKKKNKFEKKGTPKQDFEKTFKNVSFVKESDGRNKMSLKKDKKQKLLEEKNSSISIENKKFAENNVPYKVNTHVQYENDVPYKVNSHIRYDEQYSSVPEISFPRGKIKIVKNNSSISINKKREPVVNIFDHSSIPNKEISFKKGHKNRFFKPQEEHLDKSSDEQVPEKKKKKKGRKRPYQQIPDEYSLEKARHGLTSMLSESLNNSDKLASNFKKIVQKQKASKTFIKRSELKNSEYTKKVYDKTIIMQKLTKKQRALDSAKNIETMRNSENLSNKKLSKKFKQILEKSNKADEVFKPCGEEHSDKNLDKQSKQKKKKTFQQIPDEYSPEKARPMFSKSKKSFQDESVNDGDKLAADFKKLVQKQKASEKIAERLEYENKFSDTTVTMQKISKKEGSKQSSSQKDFMSQNSQSVIKRKKKNIQADDVIYSSEDRKETKERKGRTLFVGNLPKKMDHRALEKIFTPYAAVECARIRSSVPSKPSMSKKVAIITKKYHESADSLKGYVVFKTAEDAKAGLELNGTVILNHHIRVTYADESHKPDDSRSIFVGNLSFDVKEESLWLAFTECGEIENVRVIHDRETGMGKGFGFVLFKDKKSVPIAIQRSDIEIEGRLVRITAAKSGQKKNQRSHLSFRTYPTNAEKPRINTFKAKAKRIKRALTNSNKIGNKSLTKIMKKQKILHQKKKLISLLDF